MEARMFSFQEVIAGRGQFWEDVLQIHDTHGVPFDLIWLEVKANDKTPLSAEQFIEHMKMTRYGLEAYGGAAALGITYE